MRYLGVTLDTHLTFSSNVSATVSACFSVLRRIRSVRRSLTRSLTITLLTSLVLSRLDYCIAVHAGLPSSTLWRLQRVLHASARLASGVSRYAHVTPLLRDLRWLPVRARIDKRLGILAFLNRKGLAPAYLSTELTEVSSLPGRRHLRSAASDLLALPHAQHPTLGGRAVGVAASRVWNRLPQSLRSADDMAIFKKLLSNYLLNSVYGGLEASDGIMPLCIKFVNK